MAQDAVRVQGSKSCASPGLKKLCEGHDFYRCVMCLVRAEKSPMLGTGLMLLLMKHPNATAFREQLTHDRTLEEMLVQTVVYMGDSLSSLRLQIEETSYGLRTVTESAMHQLRAHCAQVPPLYSHQTVDAKSHVRISALEQVLARMRIFTCSQICMFLWSHVPCSAANNLAQL